MFELCSLQWSRSLQRTLSELRDYQQKHDSLKQQQQKLISEQASRHEKIEQTISYETYKMRLANEGVGGFILLSQGLLLFNLKLND